MSQYREIDELASALGRHLTILQMKAGQKLPGVLIGHQATIVARVATELAQAIEEHPDAEVTIDPRLNEGMEKAFLDAFGMGTDVPDSPGGLT